MALQQRKRHVRADHRRRLEHLPVIGREAVDPGGQEGLDGGRDLDVADDPGQPVVAGLPGDRLGLDQAPDALLEEEGVAFRPLDHPLR